MISTPRIKAQVLPKIWKKFPHKVFSMHSASSLLEAGSRPGKAVHKAWSASFARGGKNCPTSCILRTTLLPRGGLAPLGSSKMFKVKSTGSMFSDGGRGGGRALGPPKVAQHVDPTVELAGHEDVSLGGDVDSRGKIEVAQARADTSERQEETTLRREDLNIVQGRLHHEHVPVPVDGHAFGPCEHARKIAGA